MDIRQVSVTYLPEQDRILVRISTDPGSELRLWFTRRLVLGLWPALTKAMDQATEPDAATPAHSPEARRAVSAFQREAALRQADFATPYRAEAATALPLGDLPLLVSEVRITPQVPGGLQIAFQEKLPGGAAPRGFQVELKGALVHGFSHLLEQAIVQSQWRLLPDAPVPDAPGSAPDTPPRYLN